MGKRPVLTQHLRRCQEHAELVARRDQLGEYLHGGGLCCKRTETIRDGTAARMLSTRKTGFADYAKMSAKISHHPRDMDSGFK